ncbi:MAG: alpha/beta hydrolase [Oceanospirillales bacterium]|nr:alpha/beta hydrolase [Oceanospirillales bacterium]
MTHYSQLDVADAPGFTARQIREQLPHEFHCHWNPSHSLEAYLRHYGLDRLVSKSDYSIARLVAGFSEVVVQRFRQRERARGTVLLVHGYMDHAGLARPLADYLFEHGWDVLLYDLPGHGLSDGAPHAVDDFFHYAEQLSGLISKQMPALTEPLTLVGHSTGGAIITTLLLRAPETRDWPLTRPVLLAPLLRPTHWQSIRRKYRWLRPWLRRVRRVYQHNSHDRDFLTFIRRRDPLQHPWIPVRWIGAMLSWIDWIEQQPSSAFCPLIIQGTEDATVEWRHNLDVFGRLFPGGEQCLVESGRHNLINEARRWRSQVFGRLLQQLERDCAEACRETEQ